MKALILTWTGFQDQEVIYPYYRLLGAGFDVKIAADRADNLGRVYGILGCNMPCHRVYGAISDEGNVFGPNQFLHSSYDLLVLPGGVKALEKLRQYEPAVQFVEGFHYHGNIIASTCHGAQMLISAGVAKGNVIAAYPSIKDDVNNAGGTWSGDPVVVSNNIVSSPHYDFMGPWMERVIQEVCK